MNASLSATYFDGETLRMHAVTVQATAEGQLQALGEGINLQVPAAELRISDRLGSVPLFVRLPDRAVIEIPCNDAAVALLERLRPAGVLSSLIHRLESHAAVAATATLVLALAVAGTLWLGLPWLAHRAAYAVPPSIEADAGRAGYTYFSRAFQPSTLTYLQRNMAYHALDRLKKARTLHVEPKIYFFHLGMANSFALPGGTIIVGDELVELARNEDEIAAVLAHEIGHVEMRHGLQSVLRNSSALIVVSTVTGDLSTLSTFSGTLPFLLLEFGYAREFESEADAFAVSLLNDAHIDPFNLALILQKLEDSRPTSGPDFSYLSTHPATEKRVAFLRSFGSKLAVTARTGQPVKKGKQRGLGVKEMDQLPLAINQAAPIYPLDLRKAGTTGEVKVDFIVNTEGTVEDAYVVSSTNPGFENAALEAVRHWKFQPGMKYGHPVNAHMRVPIGFSLSESGSGPAANFVPGSFATTTTIPGPNEASGAPDSMPYPFGGRRPIAYPESMSAAGIAGDVVVEFDVDAHGNVTYARVVSSPHPDFDEPCLEAVRLWKFQPAVKDSRAVAAHMRETLKFRIKNADPAR